MKKVLIVFAVIIALVVIWLFTLPGAYELDRSVTIEAPQEVVFEKVANFKEWPTWSPWLIMDADATITYGGTMMEVGSGYEWEGELVGAGEMELTALEGMSRVDYDLRFKTPYESEAQVYFTLEAVNDSVTTATWGMTGKMPFFMRFMIKMMVNWIKMDYDRGLAMLKDYAETGEVLSRIKYGEVVEVDGFSYVGIRHQATKEEIGALMQQDYSALQSLFTENGYVVDGAPLSVYYEMDYATGVIDFATAFPVESLDGIEAPSTFVKEKIKAGKAFTVIHTGKYEHIGNAWSAAMQYTRTKKLKADMKATMWEVYTNSPMEVSPEDYETVLYLPLK